MTEVVINNDLIIDNNDTYFTRLDGTLIHDIHNCFDLFIIKNLKIKGGSGARAVANSIAAASDIRFDKLSGFDNFFGNTFETALGGTRGLDGQVDDVLKNALVPGGSIKSSSLVSAAKSFSFKTTDDGLVAASVVYRLPDGEVTAEVVFKQTAFGTVDPVSFSNTFRTNMIGDNITIKDIPRSTGSNSMLDLSKYYNVPSDQISKYFPTEISKDRTAFVAYPETGRGGYDGLTADQKAVVDSYPDAPTTQGDNMVNIGKQTPQDGAAPGSTIQAGRTKSSSNAAEQGLENASYTRRITQDMADNYDMPSRATVGQTVAKATPGATRSYFKYFMGALTLTGYVVGVLLLWNAVIEILEEYKNTMNGCWLISSSSSAGRNDDDESVISSDAESVIKRCKVGVLTCKTDARTVTFDLMNQNGEQDGISYAWDDNDDSDDQLVMCQNCLGSVFGKIKDSGNGPYYGNAGDYDGVMSKIEDSDHDYDPDVPGGNCGLSFNGCYVNDDTFKEMFCTSPSSSPTGDVVVGTSTDTCIDMDDDLCVSDDEPITTCSENYPGPRCPAWFNTGSENGSWDTGKSRIYSTNMDGTENTDYHNGCPTNNNTEKLCSNYCDNKFWNLDVLDSDMKLTCKEMSTFQALCEVGGGVMSNIKQFWGWLRKLLVYGGIVLGSIIAIVVIVFIVKRVVLIFKNKNPVDK